VSSNPADISHAGIPVIGMDIEDIFMRQAYAKQVPGRRVYDTFRLACRARRLQRTQKCADEYALVNISHRE
jgi:hypothetical protein